MKALTEDAGLGRVRLQVDRRTWKTEVKTAVAKVARGDDELEYSRKVLE